jgi:hypothetical protein
MIAGRAIIRVDNDPAEPVLPARLVGAGEQAAVFFTINIGRRAEWVAGSQFEKSTHALSAFSILMRFSVISVGAARLHLLPRWRC